MKLRSPFKSLRKPSGHLTVECSMMLAALLLIAAAEPPGPVQTAVAQAPKVRNGAELFTYVDYPEKALLAGEAGIVSVVLRISAEGKATDCAITETSGYEVLDKTTCRLILARGRFDPARDAAGVAVAADFRTASTWGVGQTFPSTKFALDLKVNQLPASYHGPVKATLLFGEAGRVIACDVSDSSGSASADQAVCAYAKSRLTMPAPKAVGISVPAVAFRSVVANLHPQASRHD